MLAFRYYFQNPSILAISFLKHFMKWLPDKLYLKLMFRFEMGYKLNLDNPKTFSEKLQWLKLYDRRPEYTKMVDKVAVKDYVASIIGSEYIIPTIGVWDSVEDIEWDKLPEQFVMKTTIGGGGNGVVICKEKKTFNKSKAIDLIRKDLKKDIYRSLKEWPYKNVPPKILAEVYLNPMPMDNDLLDYKFFCFNGVPKYCQVISGRNAKKCIDFFDMNWEHQPFHEPHHYPFADIEPKIPSCYQEMIQAAGKLAEGKAFVRIDFYQVNNKVYFGEITFFPTSGMGGFNPQEWDLIFGEMIKLPSKSI